MIDWATYWEEKSHERNPHAQVGRTLRGEPITHGQLEAIITDVKEVLELRPGDRLLDLCCGNGMITERLADCCASVVAVDMIQKFVVDLKSMKPSITALCADVRQGIPDLGPEELDRVLIYFSLQHFTQSEALRLLDDAYVWLKPGGILLVGDVPDATRIWEFFNSTERKRAYFDVLRRGSLIVGTWFDPRWLTMAAKDIGFEAEIRAQPSELPNSHYRFDLKATKCS